MKIVLFQIDLDFSIWVWLKGLRKINSWAARIEAEMTANWFCKTFLLLLGKRSSNMIRSLELRYPKTTFDVQIRVPCSQMTRVTAAYQMYLIIRIPSVFIWCEFAILQCISFSDPRVILSVYGFFPLFSSFPFVNLVYFMDAARLRVFLT